MQVVEATAEAESFVSKGNHTADAFPLESLQGYLVAIPTMNAIHGQDSWFAEHVSEMYGDHTAWDVNTIIEILQKFFKASGGVSLPDLSEYGWRLDKVGLGFRCFAC